MAPDDTVIESHMTVDQITARFPETITVLNRFGIDMCCGGGVTLAEAAERDGSSLTEIRDALRAVLDGAGAGRGA